MPQSPEVLASSIRARFGTAISRCAVSLGQPTAEVAAGALRDTALALRDESPFGFEQLTDLCAVDYAAYGTADWATSETATREGFSRGVSSGAYEDGTYAGPRFAVVYHLLSVSHNQRLRLRVFLDGDPPRIPSVVDIWSSANWYEREAFDLMGILFEGHPDLRRILTDYGFVGHPFRKDFPISGHVETRYDPEKRRVVYEPVSIEPRVLVPRVIRHDHRFTGEEGTPDAPGQEPADA